MNLDDLGLRAVAAGDYQEAVNLFKRALEHGREARTFFGLGLAYDGLGEPAVARWAYNQVLTLDPRHEGALAALERPLPKNGPQGRKKPAALCRSSKGCFEARGAAGWRKIFFKAVNIGLGLPGSFPGEFSVGKNTYLKWFHQIADLGANAIRIYTVHPPSFYEAFEEVNGSGKRLFLFQGIWAELPDGNDFGSEDYLRETRDHIRNAVDAVYGNARIAEAPGRASGVFDHDVSAFTAGFIFGREWESCAVKAFNQSRGRTQEDYKGGFLAAAHATPFEAWLARTCDDLQAYEFETYGVSRPVSAVNWPTLDPLVHPSESNYEDELVFQGKTVNPDVCSENEDSESVDFSKITAHRGGGVFATYHVYPYYPDFMNNDDLLAENPYLAYLLALKDHHRSQPVVIAEFGVPSSRDASHWQKNGWHHGRHSEAEQGRINGLLMQTIHEAGMAGGALFSWFDEWFKRSWVFAPYEVPADRNASWFNLQDAEQNYGLLAAYPGYPGKLVTLSGRREEWSQATVLYEKTGTAPVRSFPDGADGVRTLVRLSAQHDEGFLYLLLESGEPVDFTRAHYVIGLDTCGAGTGESRLPFRTNVLCPRGMTFLFHLAGETASRILVCRSYDKYLNADTGVIKPVNSDQGAWVMMQTRTNNRRMSKDKKTFYPSHVFDMSRLRCGSLAPDHPRRNSLSDFFVSGSMLELRIPWGLINVTDPGAHGVLWMEGSELSRKTGGIGMLAASYKPEPGFLSAADTGEGENVTDTLPGLLTDDALRSYSWQEYTTPVYHTYLKESYRFYQSALSRIPEER